MDKPRIQIGQKCYAKTKLSRTELLCTITAINVNKVTIKLPCSLKGYTHVEILLKDILLLKQNSKPAIKPAKPSPKDNPYRRHLENLLSNPKPIKAPEPMITAEPIREKSTQPENDMLAILL